MVREVMEKHNATREEMANMSKGGLPSKTGVPTSCFTPPGRVVAEAKATVAISAATTEQDSAVFVSHLPETLTSSLCVSVNTSFGV